MLQDISIISTNRHSFISVYHYYATLKFVCDIGSSRTDTILIFLLISISLFPALFEFEDWSWCEEMMVAMVKVRT